MIVQAGTAILSLVAIYTAEWEGGDFWGGGAFCDVAEDFGAAKRRFSIFSEARSADFRFRRREAPIFDFFGAAKRRLRFGRSREAATSIWRS